ncbi:MAG: SulP family inorganic anion transporter [Desulfobacterales bacterium]|nr:SulP family inorganic anion transporter [Desulfobacterales bacterium]MBF0395806.1 SulP family inorganic anion transporter [Desulfobacterales bacterium]
MLIRFFPFLSWFKNYNVDFFKADAISGLTVALVLIPQSMAYAQLAGLPAYYGLYASFLPPMMAALFGSSRQLATGPVAVVSLMTSASLEPLATAGSESYIAYAILLALIVGIFQLSLGILRLGLVVNFLSHPVVNGFTNAAALIIATSQLSKMFGVYVENAPHHYETIINVCKAALHYTHIPTLLMGIFAFAIMYSLKRIAPKIPNVLVAVTITTLISWLFAFEHNTNVDILSIEYPEAHNMIDDFNRSVNYLNPLAEEKTKLNKELDIAKSTKDRIKVLNAEHEMTVISLKMDKLKEEAQIIKDQIRNILFVGIKQQDGSLKFYPKDQKIEGAQTDGRIWRIKIGNNPLKKDKIKMMGGGAVVGYVPKGLPALTVPHVDIKGINHLLPYAIIISLLGFMEAISIAKAMAAKTGQRLDPNQELIGQGLANIFGAIGKGYPTSGSFSRSAVNLQTGAMSGLSSVFASIAVVIALMFCTHLLYHLPESVLAAVIMIAVISLLNVSGFIHAWRAQWYDGAISIISFICTLIFAPHLDKGIMVGVVLSLMVFLYKSMRPTVSSLSRHDDNALRDSLTHDLMECSYIDLIRFEGTLFFANATYLEDKINERIMAKKTLKHIIIAAHGINDIDASGEEALSLVIDRIRSAGIDISFSGINETVMTVLKRTHLYEKIGQNHIFPTMEGAILAVHEKTHRGASEPQCPLTTVCRIVKQNMR